MIPGSQPVTLDGVRRLAAAYDLIPLTRTLLADLNTPVAAYLNSLRGRHTRYSYLLESVEGGEKLGRYSYIGVDPDLLIRQRKGKVAIRRNLRSGSPSAWEPAPAGLLDAAREEVRHRRMAPVDGAPPSLAGAVGFFGYDMVHSLERIPVATRDDLGVDDALLMFFSRQLIFDHVRHQITLVACVAADAPDLEAAFHQALADLDAMTARLHRTPQLPRPLSEAGPMRVTPNCERAAFESAVERAKSYIQAGDIFQVVLSQRFDVATSIAPFQVYRALRTINPSPFMFFLQLGAVTVAGASPELLVQVKQGQLTYRPIAGTRPRGASEALDEELARELLADEKERAEHVMLVDLGRNDIGRVAEVGSVGVAALMTVEKYSHVQHLVSEIHGRLRPGCDLFDALASCFPAGTLSGAPKVRAMQIIEELEPTRRATYGGSVVHLDYSGNLSSCILIRSVLFQKQMAYIQAGAGIVADSIPANEYTETVNKAGAMMRALERARAGL